MPAYYDEISHFRYWPLHFVLICDVELFGFVLKPYELSRSSSSEQLWSRHLPSPCCMWEPACILSALSAVQWGEYVDCCWLHQQIMSRNQCCTRYKPRVWQPISFRRYICVARFNGAFVICDSWGRKKKLKHGDVISPCVNIRVVRYKW